MGALGVTMQDGFKGEGKPSGYHTGQCVAMHLWRCVCGGEGGA